MNYVRYKNMLTRFSSATIIFTGLMVFLLFFPVARAQALTWTIQTSNTTSQLQDITWSGSQYVAVGMDGTIVTSPDGVAWTVQTSNAGSTTRLSNVIWSGTQFVAVGGPLNETGTGVIVTSPDGVTWTSQISNAAASLNSVIWSGTLFVAVGNSGTIVTSQNGVTWTARTGGITDQDNNKVIWSGTQFVVVGGTGAWVGGGSIVTSQDGVTWTQRLDNPSELNSVVWNGTQFVAVGGTYGQLSETWIVTSPDGITWTGRVPSAGGILVSVLWNGSRFVAVGNPESIGTSEDGVTWVLRKYSTASALRSVAWSGTEFAAVGYGPWVSGELLLSSPDGVAWASDASDAGQTLVLNSVVYGNTQFIAVGDGGDILMSDVAAGSTGATADSTANSRYAATNLDPINTFSGELFSQKPRDLDLGGPMPLYFQRYYASYLRRSFILGDLGSNWRHNFDARLFWSGNTITYVSHDGRVTKFQQDVGTGVWSQQTNTDTPYQLSAVGGEDVKLYDPEIDRIYTFDFTTSSVIIGKLVKIEDGHGNVHTVTYDLDTGQIQTVSDGLGRTLTFTYNTDAIPKTVIVTDGTRSVNFQYTDTIDSEYLTIFTDVQGGMTTYAYEDTSANADHALMLSMTQPRGNIPYTQTFFDTSTAASGRVATQTDADGNAFGFDYSGLDTTLTDPLGNTRVQTHTATGELSNSQDNAGQDIVIGSDATGRRNSITDRLGDVTTMSYHAPSGKLESRTNADGTTSSFSYTERPFGNLTLYDITGITHADATTESFTYDANGNATSHTDQAGNVSTSTYDGNGQPLTITNRAGGMSTMTYNADETMATNTDPAGNPTAFGYDALKRPNLITRADGSTVNFTYDNTNRLLTTTDENSNTTTLNYDPNGNPATITDPLDKITNFTYDGNDRLLSMTDPLTGVSSRTYDELGRVGTTTDPMLSVTTYGYDIHNRLTSVTDPLLNVWGATYDLEGVIASRSDPLLNTTNYVSDKMGRITETTSHLGNVSSVSYDAMGKVSTSTDPLGNITTFNRDARGLLSGIELPGGTISTGYARNALGQMTAVTDPNTNDWLRAYDTGGRMTSVTDPLGRTQAITYDTRNRLSTITYPGGLGSVTMSYDAVGNLTGHTFSDGTTTSYTYDDNNRRVAATGIARAYDANGRISSSNGIAITRDLNGNITSMTLAPGKVVTYAYDANDQLTTVTDWAGGVTGFTHDNAGRLTDITRPNSVNTTNTWDNDSRLTGLTEGTISTISLTRDANGQITSATRTVPQAASAAPMSSSDTFDAASQIIGATYDAVGRMTGNGTDSFTWNLASLLTGYTVDGTTVSATYDAESRRTSRTTGGVTRDYVWNDALGLNSTSVEKQGGADLKYYIHTPGGQLLYSMDATTNARNIYHYDEMGNTIAVTNDAGAVIGSYAYSPFGEITGSTGGLDNPFTWQGKYGIMDEGNGLYYIRARYYDSSTGRFINRDPVKSTTPKEINPYQYALNNPLRFVDLTGRESVSKEEIALANAEADLAVAIKRYDDATDAKVATAIAHKSARIDLKYARQTHATKYYIYFRDKGRRREVWEAWAAAESAKEIARQTYIKKQDAVVPWYEARSAYRDAKAAYKDAKAADEAAYKAVVKGNSQLGGFAKIFEREAATDPTLGQQKDGNSGAGVGQDDQIETVVPELAPIVVLC